MTRTEWKRTRSGITLIEILVVIAIIGVLLALTAAALQKTVEGQKVRSSEAQVLKLQDALNQEYERVVATADKQAQNKQGTAFKEIEQMCEHEPTRTRSVWIALQLRLAFPETFAEATARFQVTDSNGNLLGQINPLPMFAGMPTYTGASPFSAEEESGALLYLILSKRSVQGGGAMATAAEDLTEGTRRKVSFNGREMETFADAFQQSVGFKRWEQSLTGNPQYEVQNSPHVDPAKAYATAPTANRDPLDPTGKTYAWLNSLPTMPAPGDPRRALMDVRFLAFNQQNRVPSVYSLGRTKVDRATPVPNPTPLDDILGFRLAKPGQRGYLK